MPTQTLSARIRKPRVPFVSPLYAAPAELLWDATLLRPDPSSATAQLKDQPGKDLIKYGTGHFDDTLLRDHLIDEFRFWIMPVVAGAAAGAPSAERPDRRVVVVCPSDSPAHMGGARALAGHGLLVTQGVSREVRWLGGRIRRAVSQAHQEPQLADG